MHPTVIGWPDAAPLATVDGAYAATAVVYLAAVVLGNRQLVDTPGQGAVFVLATGLASALVIAALAVHTMLG